MASAITLRILGDASSASKAVDEIEKKVGGLDSEVAKRSEAIKANVSKGLTVGGAAIGGFGMAITKMAAEGEQSQARLNQAIKNSGGTYDQYAAGIDKAIKANNRFGADNNATQAALTALTNATGSTSKALEQMGLVADLAAAKGITLEEAAQLVAKIDVGKGAKALAEFGISARNADGSMKSAAQAAEELAAKVGGSAAAQADTMAGKFKAIQARAADLAEALGAKVGPALAIAGPAMAGVGQVMQSSLLPALASGIAKAAAWAASMVASAVTAAASWLASMAAMAASAIAAGVAMIIPFLPVIVTVGAIGAAVYLLWRNWDTVWGFIKGAAAAAGSFLKGQFDMIVGYVGGFIDTAKQLFLNFTPLGQVIQNFDAIVGFVKAMPGRIADAASGMWDGIKNAFKAAINWIIKAWNGLDFKLPEVDTRIPGVGKIGGFTIGTPDIPMLAAGGTVTRRGLAVVGERGPELLDLNAGARVTPLPAGPDTASPNMEVHLHVTNGMDQRQAENWLEGALSKALSAPVRLTGTRARAY